MTDSVLGQQHEGVEASREFRRLFETNFDYLCRTLRRLGIPEAELEDVAQEVFLRVYEKLPEYDPGRCSMKGWLFGFAHRVAMNHVRLVRHERERPSDMAPPLMHEDTPEACAERSEGRARILFCLHQLAYAKRAVLVMHDLDGFSAPEISRALEIPVNTAYSRLRAARAEFKMHYQRAQAEDLDVTQKNGGAA